MDLVESTGAINHIPTFLYSIGDPGLRCLEEMESGFLVLGTKKTSYIFN